MLCTSLPFIFADVGTEAVKGEMPLLRSQSRCMKWEQVSLILSPLKQDKAMNFDRGPPYSFSGASTAAPTLLDGSHFHCAAFGNSERKVRLRTVPQA